MVSGDVGVITIISSFRAGYFIHEYRGWKGIAVSWHQQYENIKKD
jgi:hypothetical protein